MPHLPVSRVAASGTSRPLPSAAPHTPAPGISMRGVPVMSCTSVQRATCPAPPGYTEFGEILTLNEELRSKVYICILEGLRFSGHFSP